MSYGSVTKALSILRALKGRSLEGMANKDIAAATGMTTADVSRISAVMIEAGFLIQNDSGKISLSVQMLQIAQAHQMEVDSGLSRIHEFDQRVKSGANN